MSGSDLATFVAAMLRDEVVGDLSEENRQLREENDRLRTEARNGLRRPPTAELITGGDDGRAVFMRGTFERRDCMEQDQPFCSLVPCGSPAVSSLLGCELQISGNSWGEASGGIEYAEWYEDAPAVLTTFGQAQLKVWFQVDSREDFLSLLGVHRGSTEQFFHDLELHVDDVVFGFPRCGDSSRSLLG